MYDPQTKELSFVDIDSAFHIQDDRFIFPFHTAPITNLPNTLQVNIDQHRFEQLSYDYNLLQENEVTELLQNLMYEILMMRNYPNTIDRCFHLYI